MLINKKNTQYGFSASIRYDVKNPAIHVLQPKSSMILEGEADLTIISGDVSITRSSDSSKKIYDSLTEKDTYRIPLGEKAEIKTKSTMVVIIEDNHSLNRVNQYLNLEEVTEDEPSSDDLDYISLE